MPVIKIILEKEEKTIEFAGKMLLSDAIRQAGLHFDMPCAGKQICAKCRIKAAGKLSPYHEFEQACLSSSEMADGVRLACCTYALGDAYIYYNTNPQKMQVQEDGLMPEYEKSPLVKLLPAALETPTLENPLDDERNIKKATGLAVPLRLLKNLPGALRDSGFKPNILAFGDTALDIIPQGKKYYGAAIDIGTTTVAAYLYDLESCAHVATASGHNAQSAYGADVISRIEFAASSSDGRQALSGAIVKQINSLFSKLAEIASISVEQIYAVVITGNTTMLHLLCGIDPKYIALSPFAPASVFGKRLDACALGLNINPCGAAYLAPCISAYVGGDITTGIIASNLDRLEGYNLMIDIGTNGEIVVATPKGIVCCSTAAGPAFEGAGLYMGMAGVEGAISKVWAQDGKIKYNVIGDKKPTGVCGSGIIDAVAVMLKEGVLDDTGRILDEDHGFLGLLREREGQPAFELGDSGVLITQKDVRQVQLAKAAIAGGIQTLLHECAIDVGQVDGLFIAGGFGSHIDCSNAAAIGLFPEILLDRVTALGNAAGIGACMLLLSDKLLKRAEDVAQNAVTIELSANPYFMEKYVECMMF